MLEGETLDDYWSTVQKRGATTACSSSRTSTSERALIMYRTEVCEYTRREEAVEGGRVLYLNDKRTRSRVHNSTNDPSCSCFLLALGTHAGHVCMDTQSFYDSGSWIYGTEPTSHASSQTNRHSTPAAHNASAEGHDTTTGVSDTPAVRAVSSAAISDVGATLLEFRELKERSKVRFEAPPAIWTGLSHKPLRKYDPQNTKTQT